MSPSLHQSLLMVTDLDESTAFYRDAIGIEPDRIEGSNVEFDTGACTLVLESDFDRDVLDAFGLPEPGSDRGHGVIIAIDVGNPEAVNETCERVQRTGADVRMGPRDVDWGRRMAIVTDPDGYSIEVSAPNE